jgi:predicted transposase/invertase (TIGR01784 family)
MKTDSIFYRLFQVFPGSFFDLIGESTSQANIYEFTSIELKQTAFRIDGLFLPASEDGSYPIYFVEVQFQKDQKLYARLFAEIFLYLRLYEPSRNWYAVVLFAQRNLEPDYIEPYRTLLDSYQVQRLYLNELLDPSDQPFGVKIVQLIVEAEDRTLEQANQLLEQAKQEFADPFRKREIIELIETIVLYKFPRMSREEFAKMFEVNDLKQTRFYQEVAEEARQEGVQQGIQEGMQQGIQEGMQQGIQQGIQQGKLQTVAPLLARGFSVEEVAEILSLDVQQVRQIAQDRGATDN